MEKALNTAIPRIVLINASHQDFSPTKILMLSLKEASHELKIELTKRQAGENNSFRTWNQNDVITTALRT